MVKQMIARLRALAKNEDGVTALEYGLIASAIVIAISVILPSLGTTISGVFNSVNTAL